MGGQDGGTHERSEEALPVQFCVQQNCLLVVCIAKALRHNLLDALQPKNSHSGCRYSRWMRRGAVIPCHTAVYAVCVQVAAMCVVV